MSDAVGPKGRPSRFADGVIWNVASLAILAIAGFGLNIAIGRFYGPADLGLFNICLALFIALAQIGSFGLQFSVLQFVSELADSDRSRSDLTVTAGLASVAAVSTAVTALSALATPLLAAVFDEPQFAQAFLLVLPGLWAFSINKYLFGAINGARHMKTFAVLQSARYAAMTAFMAMLTLNDAPGYALTLVLTFSELALLPLLLFYCRRTIGRWRLDDLRPEVRRHISFGVRGFLSGAALELNTRVDVLLIGALMSVRHAGIYSVALLVAEGLAQAIFALRNNVNPLLAGSVSAEELRVLSRKVLIYGTSAMAAVSVVAAIAYPYFVRWVLADPQYLEAGPALWVLLAGLTLTAAAQVFGMLLSQRARPGLHTAFVTAVLLFNVAGNLVLIPWLGITGSALATAASYVFAAIVTVVLARRLFGVRLFI